MFQKIFSLIFLSILIRKFGDVFSLLKWLFINPALQRGGMTFFLIFDAALARRH
jgi:hypothetical protein